MDSGVTDFGLVEKDVLCEIVTITVGVGFPIKASLGLFLLILFHIASKKKRKEQHPGLSVLLI